MLLVVLKIIVGIFFFMIGVACLGANTEGHPKHNILLGFVAWYCIIGVPVMLIAIK